MVYDYLNDRMDGEPEKDARPLTVEGGEAVAEGSISLNEAAFQAFLTDSAEIWMSARHSGILAASDAGRLMFVTYSVNLAGINLAFETDDGTNSIKVTCHVRTRERLRAEIPALVGCGAALMSIAGRLMVMDRDLKITDLRIVKK